MSVNTNNAYGRISISDLAIAKVASNTALESYGIMEMVSRRFTDTLALLLKKDGEGRPFLLHQSAVLRLLTSSSAIASFTLTSQQTEFQRKRTSFLTF